MTGPVAGAAKPAGKFEGGVVAGTGPPEAGPTVAVAKLPGCETGRCRSLKLLSAGFLLLLAGVLAPSP